MKEKINISLDQQHGYVMFNIRNQVTSMLIAIQHTVKL